MSEVLSLFDAHTADWFAREVGTPTAVQQEGWPAILSGEHVLISAPTGTGKTLSAFLVAIDQLKGMARAGTLEERLYLIYVSPLKALGNDIRENLRRPLSGIKGPELQVAIRNGDTTNSERQRMLRHPPHILITTPESLYLLLTTERGQGLLETARTIILDELHALINSKRGAHMMLSLARLDAIAEKPLQRIGLSATIEPLSQAAAYLAQPDPVRIVAPEMHKAMDIEVNSPLPDMRVLPEGTVWPAIAESVVEHCQGKRTVIAFLEGRAQAEKLAYQVNQIAGEAFARTHHGCVSKEQRLEAERQLRAGELRLLCATSSMELGIDVGEVDLVLQVGYPGTISSTMQRLGRAGHNPGRVSVMHMFPRTASEAIPCGLTASVALGGGIEQSRPPESCLDVLAQHLVSMAVARPYTVENALALMRRAYPFRDVTRPELENVLRMLAGDFEHQLDQPARPRLLYDRIHGRIQGDAYSRMLALSAGGTIPDRGFYTVRLADGTRLGELEEEFVFEARVGDKFLLGAFAWRIQEFRRDSVVVSPSTPEGAQAPFWRGDWSGRSFQTGERFGALLRGLWQAQREKRMYEALRDLRLDDAAARNAAEFLRRQKEATGVLPDDQTIILEHFADASGEHQLMVHSVFGGAVNAGLALLMQEAARRQTGMDVRCFEDDDGFLVYPYGGEAPLPEGLLQGLQPQQARPILDAMLPATPLFNMAFRYNAGRALMMGVRKGGRQPLWVQRMKGAQALDGAVRQPDHPLMKETRRECLDDYWDLPGVEEVLRRIQRGTIQVHELHLQEPSPMSLPLRRRAEAELMYDYTPTTTSVHRVVEEALEAQQGMAPAPEQLLHAAARVRQPRDMEQLHTLLMVEGDLLATEVDVPVQWLETLAREERASYIEPGLWISAEHRTEYQAALEEQEDEAQRRIIRRCLRYHGAQDAISLSERYFLPEGRCLELLEMLAAEGVAVEQEGLYYHAEVYQRAQRQTVAARRRQVETLPPERFAALLAQQVRVHTDAPVQLRQAILSLLEVPFAPSMWESVLLPARVAEYRPAMLDELLAEGEFYWRMTPGEKGEKPLLAFYRYEDIDWERSPFAQEEPLADSERLLVDALERRGATFAQGLSGVLPGESPLDVMQRLAARGLVRADSFAPVRRWMEGAGAKKQALRVRMRGRAIATMTGRWELTRPVIPLPMEQRLQRAFDQKTLLCRETAKGLVDWSLALETLRIWEYAGQVRRGYFIRGLSGAQFIREGDYQATLLALQQPQEEILWLNAADPAQGWGKLLPHMEDRAFANVPGTAVALRAGVPVALLERHGQTLQVMEAEHLHQAMQAFARDYAQRRIFPDRQRITIKQAPPEATKALEGAGFIRQMLDYELWQRSV